MKEFLVRFTDDLHQISGYIFEHFESSDKSLKIKVTNCGNRSLSQNAFQHVIYGEISKYLISKGRTDWTPEYVKENMKNAFLGWEERVYIHPKTGCKESRSVLRKTSTLDRGESYRFTTELLEWCESIGLSIKIPSDCEYMNLKREQNE